MKFSMIFQGVDKVTKVMKKISSAEKKAAGAMKGNAAKAARSTAQAQRANGLLARSFAGIGRASSAAFGVVGRGASGLKVVFRGVGRVATGSFRGVVKGAQLAGRAVKKLHEKTKQLAKTGLGNIGDGFSKVGRGAVVAGGVLASIYGSAALAAGSMVDVASQFEKFQTILETTEGSNAKAQEAMKWVQDFAVKTPYELDQVTDAFVTMRSYGLDPTNGLLKTLGDTSAAMGKPLMQAVEAVADAVTGENERLKEFGIKASKNGSKITYAYTNAAGKGVKATVDAADRMAIQQKLMAIMNEKYAGSMERLSGTWGGMMSNLADQWAKFQLMIMNSGLFDWMKGRLKSVLDQINAMEANGSLKAWAKSIGQAIQNALTSMWDFATRAYEAVSKFADGVGKVTEFVGGWENLAMILGGLTFAPALIATAQGIILIAKGVALLSAAITFNPITLGIMAVVAAVAGAAYLIYDNWDAVKAFFIDLWDGVKVAGQKLVDWFSSLNLSQYLPELDWAGSIPELSWGNVIKVLDWASWLLPIRWLDFIPGFSWKAIFTSVLNWTDYIPALDLSSYFDFSWSDILPDWDWGSIIPDMPQWASPSSWFGGDDKPKEIKAPKIALSSPAEAQKMSQLIVAIQGDFEKLSGAAGKVSSAVSSAIQAAQSALASTDFSYHGQRLMETLAVGMRARAQVVVQEIANTMQQVRNHLPSSPAKVGPLSDIHKLKFGETIAGSIRAEPMVKAMRAAAAATMFAASPTGAMATPDVVAGKAVGAQAGIHSGGGQGSSRAVQAVARQNQQGQSGGGKSSSGATIHYSPTITISGDAASAQANFKQMLESHKREIKRMMDEEMRREGRRKH